MAICLNQKEHNIKKIAQYSMSGSKNPHHTNSWHRRDFKSSYTSKSSSSMANTSVMGKFFWTGSADYRYRGMSNHPND